MTQQFSDQGLLLSVYPASGGATLSLLTQHHGLVSGFVKSKKKLAVGNLYTLDFYARLETHLGRLSLSEDQSFQSLLLFDKTALSCFNLMQQLCLSLLSEKEAFPVLFDVFIATLQSWEESLSREFVLKTYLLFELLLLKETGFGLSLDQCALSGVKTDLIYLSPKTGCAASKESGAPYSEKLLPLPAFFLDPAKDPSEDDLKAAYFVLGHFLKSHFQEQLFVFFKQRELLQSS
ncbi:MAG: DNA repair protein RecO [Alphaproteobacteria bacterium]|nr:DNA repair protein RecO [Alphaproteobacteria bacterium]MBN2779894.1 DNA repair protein RecO [Alphaproteobacteria bacterium]